MTADWHWRDTDDTVTLDAYRYRVPNCHGHEDLKVWCEHERVWHIHGAGDNPGDGDGYRAAHCRCPDSPLKATGYFLREIGAMTAEVRRAHRPSRGHRCPTCKRCPNCDRPTEETRS